MYRFSVQGILAEKNGEATRKLNRAWKRKLGFYRELRVVMQGPKQSPLPAGSLLLEVLSKLLVSPLPTPIVVPYIIPYITPL